MSKITIECEVGEVSDGYHTFNELYDHRCVLFSALMLSNPSLSWRARNNSDGSHWDGWFVAGMTLPTGDVSYHLPDRLWSMLDGVETSDTAPEWDGHTSKDVVERLSRWCFEVTP